MVYLGGFDTGLTNYLTLLTLITDALTPFKLPITDSCHIAIIKDERLKPLHTLFF